MQIQIDPPGPPQMMEMSFFGRASPELTAYIQHRNQEVDYRLQNFGEAGQRFMRQSEQFYQDFADRSGIKAAESMILSGVTVLTDNLAEILSPLETFEQLQEAHSRYQYYLMANPAIRTLYLQDRIEGYVDTYENREGDAVGLTSTPYREVINGMSRSSYDPDFPDDGEEQWVTTTQDTLDGEPEPSFLEKVNIINAWNLQNAALAENLDPTSIDGFEVRPEP